MPNTQKQFIESKIEQFNEYYADEMQEYYCCDGKECACNGTKLSDELRRFISTALKEIVEEHFKEIMVEKLSRKDWDMECDPDSYFFIGIHQHEGNNHCLDQITSRHKEFTIE